VRSSPQVSDLEIAVPANRFDEIAAALNELEFFVVSPGVAEPVAQAGDRLTTSHQTWGLDRAANVWRIDVFREPHDGDQWVARRDETIRLPYAELIEHTADGIPYERPEVVLLFKAKHSRPKDEADLAAALPHLSRERRQLLRDWIAQPRALLATRPRLASGRDSRTWLKSEPGSDL
jgi:hypothetical protein